MTSTVEFEVFAAARAAALYRTAWLLCGEPHLAEDLVQETLARVFVRWRAVSRMDNPAAYARRVLVNVHVSHRRLRRNQERPVADPAVAEVGRPSDDADLRLTLLDALARLDRVDRTVLVLRYWEDLDVSTTAGLLRMSPANVRTRSVRALHRLRAVLGNGLGDGLGDGMDTNVEVERR